MIPQRQDRLASGHSLLPGFVPFRLLPPLSGNNRLNRRFGLTRLQLIEKLAFFALQTPIVLCSHQHSDAFAGRLGIQEELVDVSVAVHHRQVTSLRRLLGNLYQVPMPFDPAEALLLRDRAMPRPLTDVLRRVTCRPQHSQRQSFRRQSQRGVQL